MKKCLFNGFSLIFKSTPHDVSRSFFVQNTCPLLSHVRWIFARKDWIRVCQHPAVIILFFYIYTGQSDRFRVVYTSYFTIFFFSKGLPLQRFEPVIFCHHPVFWRCFCCKPVSWTTFFRLDLLFPTVASNFKYVLFGFARNPFAVSLPLLMAGTTLGWSSPMIQYTASGTSPVHLDSSQESWMVTYIDVGNALLSVPAGILMDRIGRKGTAYLTVPITLVGWMLILLARQVSGRRTINKKKKALEIRTETFSGGNDDEQIDDTVLIVFLRGKRDSEVFPVSTMRFFFIT